MFAGDDLHPDLVEIDALVSRGFAEAEGRTTHQVVPEDAVVITGPPGSPGRTTVAAAFCLAHSIFRDTVALDLDPYAPALGELVGREVGFELPAMGTGDIGLGRRGPGEVTIVDLGPVPASSPLLRHRGPLIAVIEGTDDGLERALDWFDSWAGSVPLLLVNRTVDAKTLVPRIRDQVGLEPITVIPELEDPVPEIARRLIHLDLDITRFRS